MRSHYDHKLDTVSYDERNCSRCDESMQAFHFEHPFIASLALALVVAAAGGLASAGLGGIQNASAEGGFLEGFQELLLLMACGVYAGTALRQHSAGRMASFGAMALAGVFLLRELEFPVIGPLSAYVNSADFRWHEAFILASAAGIYIFRRWQLLPRILQHFQSRHAVPYVLLGIFLLVGDFFDTNRLEDRHLSTFLEELSETFAYLVFAASGFYVMLRHERAANQ